ncbi:MAG: hypothetical protein RIR62_2070 [Pseudomonadota bacterium]|jgi:hypothetical protein
MRSLLRVLLLLAIMASLALTLNAAQRLATGPELAIYRDALASEIVAATDRALAEQATPAALAARLAARLDEDPRDWVVIDALAELAGERGIALPDDLVDRLQRLRAEDSGLLATAQSCAACVMDSTACTVTLVLLCRAPVDLTVAGDIAGIARAGTAYATGGTVDDIDLALSITGLGATALVVVTGGSSLAVKAGAGLARIARNMGRMSGGLSDLARGAVRNGIDWAALPAIRSTDDLARAIRADALAPLAAVAADLTRLQAATGTARALHLLPLVSDANSARRLANAAEALGGPRLVARADLLGPARLMRATVRLSDAALGFAASLTAFLSLLALSIAGAIKSAILRRMRRAA